MSDEQYQQALAKIDFFYDGLKDKDYRTILQSILLQTPKEEDGVNFLWTQYKTLTKNDVTFCIANIREYVQLTKRSPKRITVDDRGGNNQADDVSSLTTASANTASSNSSLGLSKLWELAFVLTRRVDPPELFEGTRDNASVESRTAQLGRLPEAPPSTPQTEEA